MLPILKFIHVVQFLLKFCGYSTSFLWHRIISFPINFNFLFCLGIIAARHPFDRLYSAFKDKILGRRWVLNKQQSSKLLFCQSINSCLISCNRKPGWDQLKLRDPEAEFKEFEPRLKSAKIRFKLSAGLNLLTFDTILSGTNHI